MHHTLVSWFTAHMQTPFFPLSRPLLSKSMDERGTDSLGLKRPSIPMLGKGETPDSWCSCESQRLPVPCTRACVGHCASLAGVLAATTRFVGDAASWTRTSSFSSLSHIISDGWRASQIGFLAHSEFAASLPVYPTNMFGKLSRTRTREMGNDSICQDREHQRHHRGHG